MPADIRLGDVRAWEMDDVPGLRLNVAIVKGQQRAQMWFDVNGRRINLAVFRSSDHAQQFADYLDMMADQINRATQAALDKETKPDDENQGST
ncbi:MAG: hypothetical protein ACRDQZ_04730 [Mycobacteriales bacterium]